MAMQKNESFRKASGNRHKYFYDRYGRHKGLPCGRDLIKILEPLFFNALEVDQVFLSHKKVKKLIAPDLNGDTPLHILLKTDNLIKLKAYFGTLRKVMAEKRVKVLGTHFFLIASNRLGYTPFHIALMAGVLENLNIYLEEVAFFRQSGFISDQMYHHLFVNSNQFGNTPLHCALRSSKIEIVKRCFEEIVASFKDNIIFNVNYSQFFTSMNQQGYTLLHLAAMTGNREIVKQMINIIGNELGLKRLLDNLQEKSNNRHNLPPQYYRVREDEDRVVNPQEVVKVNQLLKDTIKRLQTVLSIENKTEPHLNEVLPLVRTPSPSLDAPCFFTPLKKKTSTHLLDASNHTKDELLVDDTILIDPQQSLMASRFMFYVLPRTSNSLLSSYEVALFTMQQKL